MLKEGERAIEEREKERRWKVVKERCRFPRLRLLHVQD